MGSVGDSYDNALAETINGLYKAEVIHRRGPWRSREAVEFATLEWVDWFNNQLFDLTEPQRYGGPSVPTLYRWRREGLIDFTKSGALSKLTRPTMKRILGKGVALTVA